MSFTGSKETSALHVAVSRMPAGYGVVSLLQAGGSFLQENIKDVPPSSVGNVESLIPMEEVDMKAYLLLGDKNSSAVYPLQ